MDQAFCGCSIGTVSSLVLPNMGLVTLSCNLKERFYVGLQGEGCGNGIVNALPELRLGDHRSYI